MKLFVLIELELELMLLVLIFGLRFELTFGLGLELTFGLELVLMCVSLMTFVFMPLKMLLLEACVDD